MTIEQRITVQIEWMEPVCVTDIGSSKADMLKGKGGIYLWYTQPPAAPSPVVIYVGETKNFDTRMADHIATMLGHGGTIIGFADDVVDPYNALYQDLDPATLQQVHKRYKSDSAAIRFAYDRENKPFLAYVNDNYDWVQSALKRCSIICGEITRNGTKDSDVTTRRELEGGIIDILVKDHNIGTPPKARGMIDHVIGRRSRSPQCKYELIHAGCGKARAEAMLRLKDGMPLCMIG